MRWVLTALPKPVSASTMIGMSGSISRIARTGSASSDSVMSPRSGMPRFMFVTPAPVM